MEIIATLPPYVSHIDKIVNHPLISSLRFNSIMPIGESKGEVLQKLLDKSNNKPLFLDLKYKQLRIKSFSYLPYSTIKINHHIRVNLPIEIYFKDSVSIITKIINGNELILDYRPEHIVGDGQPINILSDSLELIETFTEDDLEYIEEWKKLGQHKYMLSFTENINDIAALYQLDSEAEIVAKIENKKGLVFVKSLDFSKYNITLMSARDDLFINIGMNKIDIIDALKLIIKQNKNAIVASRIFTSLEKSEYPSMSDISDFYMLNEMGYNRFMLSDGVCFSYNGIVFNRVMNQIEKFVDRFGSISDG